MRREPLSVLKSALESAETNILTTKTEVTATKNKKQHLAADASFNGTCLILEEALSSDARQQILSDIYKSKNFTKSLFRLRESMRANSFKTDTGQLSLNKFIKNLDNRTREEGFHVLHDWDGKADKLNKEIIPVDLLNYLLTTSGGHPQDQSLAILLDYYFMYILVLLSMRVWDGDANENLDRLTRLLDHLQGPEGSRQKFTNEAETLVLIATSHFEPDDHPYNQLLDRVKTWDHSHQVRIALAHASILGGHLRFGFEASYARDLAALRDDNVPDYPWLCFAVTTLLKEYARMHDKDIRGPDREKIVEGIINGLTPDTRAFTGKAPTSLEAYEKERAQVPALLTKYREDLFREFLNHRPSPEIYSPISFFFNFPHNLLKGMIAHALMHGTASELTLNDLLTGVPRNDARLGATRKEMALTLMGYARESPDTIRGRPMPAVVYDPAAGHRFFVKTLRIARERVFN